MEEEVVFVFEDGETQIRKDLMYCSAKFCRDFAKEEKISLKNKYKSEYRDLFQFLQKGEVPNEQTTQKIVFSLLVEWEFHFTHIDSFLMRISEIKIPIKFNQKAYVVNFGRFLIHSSVFRDLYLINPSGGLEFRFNTDEDTFIEFLDVVHGVKYAHEIDKSYEVYKICEFFGCDSLCNLFDVKKMMLKDIINGLDLSLFETYMSENLKDFLNQPEFASVPLPILIRLFQQNKEAFSFSDLRVFFNKFYHQHPSNFQVLFNSIDLKFQTEEEIDEFGQAMSLYLPGIGILASNFHEKKAAFIDEINNLQNENTRRKADDQQKIEELNQKMKRKEAEDQKRIQELNQQMEKLKNQNTEENKRIKELNQKMKQQKAEYQKNIEEFKNKFIEEYEGIVKGKWKSTKAPDFESNIFDAAAKGKLTSIIYLLANGNKANEKFMDVEFLYLITLLFIMLLLMVILVLLNI